MQKHVSRDPDYGTETIVWLDWKTVSASIQDVLPSRSERYGNAIVIANRPCRIRIRYLCGLSSDMRIRLDDRDGRVLKIIAGPAELGRREGMEIMAEEYSTSGDAR